MLLAFLPGSLWNRVLPGTGGAPASERSGAPPGRRAITLLRDGLVGAALAWVLVLNVCHAGKIELPRSLLRATLALGLDQGWALYAPRPPKKHVRFEYYGMSKGGEFIELTDAELGERWRAIRSWQGSDHRFEVGLTRLASKSGASRFLAPAFADWLCREWNAEAPPERAIAALGLVAAVHELRLDGPRPPPERRRILDPRPCPAPAAAPPPPR